MSFYLYKYIKYKNKYSELKNNENFIQIGGNKDTNQFAIKLFNVLDKDHIFSPMSIIFALSLIHLAAISNSQTDHELTNLFNHKYNLDEINQLYNLFNNDIMTITNALLINKMSKNVNNKYIASIKKLTLVSYDDFNNAEQVAKKVNDYIDKNTKSMIKNIVKSSDIDITIKLILINTIYFRAKWLHEFDPIKTSKMPFYNDKKNQIDMMVQKNNFNYYEDNNVQLLEMSYKNEDYVMGVILPKKGIPIPKLTNDEMNSMVKKLQEEEVEIYFPKFTHRKNIQLVSLLKKLDVKTLFNTDAQLNIADDAYISNIIHEAVVIVDESGTEASAATVVIGKSMAMPNQRIIVFKADHPFVYYIRHRPTNIILFFGSFCG